MQIDVLDMLNSEDCQKLTRRQKSRQYLIWRIPPRMNPVKETRQNQILSKMFDIVKLIFILRSIHKIFDGQSNQCLQFKSDFYGYFSIIESLIFQDFLGFQCSSYVPVLHGYENLRLISSGPQNTDLHHIMWRKTGFSEV